MSCVIKKGRKEFLYKEVKKSAKMSWVNLKRSPFELA